MKNQIRVQSLVAIAIAAIGALLFQSCSPSNKVQPMPALSHTVTVNIKDMATATLPIGIQSPRHLSIVAIADGQKTVLDTNINGSFSYSFQTAKQGIDLTATLTSTSAFVNTIEFDVDGVRNAYHSGSCAVTEYDLSDNIIF